MRRLLCIVAVLLGGCGSGGDDASTRSSTTIAATSTTTEATTTSEGLSLADKGFSEACGFRAIDLILPVPPDVASYITWLRTSRFAQLRELAEDMANANAAGVEAAVDELTRLCARAGYKFQ